MSLALAVGLAAICTAIVGGIAILMSNSVKFGVMTARIDQNEKDNARLAAELSNLKNTTEVKLDRLIEGVDQKLDRIWEYLRQLSTRRATDRKPPIGGDD